MPRLVYKDSSPSLEIDSLTVPIKGEVAEAIEVEDVFRQLLNNDAALKALLDGPNPVTLPEIVECKYQFINTVEGGLLSAWLPVPQVGVIVSAYASAPCRVKLQYAVADNDPLTRSPYEPPLLGAGLVLDLGFYPSGGGIKPDKPILYYEGSMSMNLSVIAWDGSGAVDVTLYIVPLAAQAVGES
jgi:hypothetical protein